MKTVLTSLICLFGFLLSAQDSTETERIYYGYSDGIYPEKSLDFPFLILKDSLTQKPIDGWLVLDYKKTIWVEHYSNGRQSGYHLRYNQKKSKFHLTRAGYLIDSEFPINKEQWVFLPKAQEIDSASYSYGLNKMIISWPDTTNKNLITRTINVGKASNKVKDEYYYPEAKKTITIRYKRNNLRQVFNPTLLDSIYMNFPPVLNANKNPFSLIRFDGIYENHSHTGDEQFRNSQFLRFYPNGTVKFAYFDGVIRSFTNWDEINSSPYSLKGNTIAFKINGTEIKFSEGRFYSNFLLIKTTYYKNGIAGRSDWMFKPDYN